MAIDENGNTDLMQAVMDGDIAEIERLLDILTEEEKEAVNNEGYTVLHMVAEKGYIDVAKALLDAGANVDARIYEGGLTPIIIALQENNTEVAKLLLEYGASVNSVENISAEEESDEGSVETIDDGLRPLTCASHHGNVDIMRRLITKGANLNDISAGAESALSATIEAEKVAGTELLLAKGAEIDGENMGDRKIRGIIASNPLIKNLLDTAGIVDRIFAKEELTEEDEEFINNDEFNEHVAAQRFISLCIINAEGARLNQQIASASRLFQDNFASWFNLGGEAGNLSEAINQLIADGLSLRHQQIISNLFRISESSYKDTVGESYEKVDQVYIILPLREGYIEEIEAPRKRSGDNLVRSSGKRLRYTEDEEDEESESSTEIDEDNVSNSGEESGEESSGGESENDADNTVASGEISAAGGNTQATQQESISLNMLSDEQDKTEKQSIIVETKVEDNTELNSWFETMFAWGYMPKWLQDDIINSTPMQAILQSIAEREAIYNPKSIADKFAEIFVIEKRDDSAESAQDNRSEKVTYAKISSEGVDTSLMYNAFKVGICILPMVAGSGMLGEFPVLGQFGAEVV